MASAAPPSCSACGAAAAPPSRFCPACGAFIAEPPAGALAGRALIDAGHLASPSAWLGALLLGVPGGLLYAASTSVCLLRLAGPRSYPTTRGEVSAVLGIVIGATLIALVSLPRGRRRYAIALAGFPLSYLALSHAASLVEATSPVIARSPLWVIVAMAISVATHVVIRRSYRD